MNAKVLAVGLGVFVLGGAAYLAATTKKAHAKPIARVYYRPQATGMPDELYKRYEECMQGKCTADTAIDLSDELDALGYKDFATDLLELVADMLGVADKPLPAEPPPQETSPQQSVADTAAALVGVLNTEGCGALTREEMNEAQRILGVPSTGLYDSETALKLSTLGYIPPPVPCELPLPAGWDAMVDQWYNQIQQAINA